MDTLKRIARPIRLLGVSCGMMLVAGLAFISDARGQGPVPGRGVVRDPSFRFAAPVTSWNEIKNRHVVMQQRDYSCGAAALATILRFYWGHHVDEATVLDVVESLLSPDQLRDREDAGLSMADLQDAAIEMGFRGTTGTLEYEKLADSKVPLIVVVDLGGTNHFVVFRGVVAGCVFLADPIRGNLRITDEAFRRTWQGNAVLVVAPPGITQSDRDRLQIRREELVRGYLNRQLIRRATSGGLTSFPGGIR